MTISPVIEFGKQLLQILVRKKHLCLSVVLQLPDALHRIFADNVLPFHPVKEHPNVADVIIDGGDTDRLAVVPPAVRVVLFLGKVIDIEGVFTTGLQIVNVSADNIFRNLVHSVNLQFIRQPTTEKMKGLFIAAHGFFS